MPSRKELKQKQVSQTKKAKKIKTEISLSALSKKSDEDRTNSASRRLRHEVSTSSPFPVSVNTDSTKTQKTKAVLKASIPEGEQQSLIHDMIQETETPSPTTVEKNQIGVEAQEDDGSSQVSNHDLSFNDSPNQTTSSKEPTDQQEFSKVANDSTEKNSSEQSEKHASEETFTREKDSPFARFPWLQDRLKPLSNLAQTTWQIWMNEEFDRIPIQNPALRLGIKYGLKQAKRLEKQVLESPITEKAILTAFQIGLKAQRAWDDLESLLKFTTKKKKISK